MCSARGTAGEQGKPSGTDPFDLVAGLLWPVQSINLLFCDISRVANALLSLSPAAVGASCALHGVIVSACTGREERAAAGGTTMRISLQQRQDERPILNIVVPHSPHLPLVAGLPFFIVTAWASRISRCSLHFKQ